MENYLIIIFRTLLLYVVILLIFRIMGKREIGELSVLDLVVFIMLGEMAVIAIEQHKDSIFHTLVPMALLMIIQMFMAFLSLKSRKFRKIIDGKPSLIISNGKIDENMMKKLRYNFDDLLMQLRTKDITNIADVEFAILETSGELSIIKKSNKKKPATYTLPIILNGKIQQDHLEKMQKDEVWLRKELDARGHNQIDQISFCSFQDGKFFIDYIDPK
ncbi:DUF421 domain-containing protein [Lederbergia wuyishanensis]|uniref:Uncharacterized membrane protein YcaP (DUF421 family) n=1 Tax=Lederbergia wuyishanensis TaxID=1347903 RepID=A0ABU0D1R0_9BACI|nr:DUF421 domain-containing protein [Lederbergia wuyishanensis]MCJ8006946.1 DUF421 domain-containing protein [Lederbergia wuyishanensis]MDQ0342330.1 uncharacterized membrane protein YcaP (DUF421 family) [Lederbergia wuyishanensis]